MLPIFYWLVYLDGGASGTFVNLFYIPIVLAAFVFGDVGGAIVAVVCAVVAGPFLPQQVVGNIAQPFYGILTRAAFFYFMAIFTARLAASVRRRGEESASLLSVAQAVSASLRLEQVLQTIAEKAVEITGAKACSIRLLSAEGSELLPAASVGLSPEYLGKGRVWVRSSGLDQDVLAGETVLLGDVTKDARFQYRRQAESEGLVSALALPLRQRERVVGVLRVYSGRRRNWSGQDRRVLEGFATQAAIAIENARLYEDIHSNYWETVRALTRAIEAKDPFTLGHSERVTSYAVQLGQELGLSHDELETLRFAAILHDIGKIGVAEKALARSASDLDTSDDVLVRMHPLIGKSILEPVAFLRPALDAVRYHHERWDGEGYPEGLAGSAIPRSARILAVANAYDHLTTDQPERLGLTREEALNDLKRRAGTQLDPEMVEAFERSFRATLGDVEPSVLI
jgi:HD-GYP domain-containing protein (c-di-GMP phosphodiesterase class II)